MQRWIGLAAFLFPVVASLFSPIALASYTVEPEIGVLNGFTQYQLLIPNAISGGDWVLSQLKFAIYNPVIGARFTAPTDSGLLLRAGVWTKVSSAAGVMEDSDWIPEDGHNGLDVYSESRLDLDGALVLDGGVALPEKNVGPVTVAAQVGFRRQQFDFSAYDLNQVGFGPYAIDYTGSVSGKVLDYSVTYNLPYVGFTASLPSSMVPVAVDLTYSPWVTAHDVDDHLLRTKRSTGDSTGAAWTVGAHTVYTLLDDLDLTGYVNYSFIHTRGTQVQYYYADSDAPAGTTYVVDQALTSEQCAVGLTLTSRF